MTAAAAGRIRRKWPNLSDLDKMLATSSAFSLDEVQRRRQPRDSLYPEEDGCHIWNYRGTVCTIVRCDWYADEVKRMQESEYAEDLAFSIKHMSEKIGNMNGYARFDKRPLYEPHYDGIVSYIPAPGGITFAQGYVDGTFVYGYDTGHITDQGITRKDKNWHVVQVEFMVDAIIIARRLEKAYRTAKTREKRIAVLSEFDRRLRLRGKQIDVSNNFGLMFRLLSGEL